MTTEETEKRETEFEKFEKALEYWYEGALLTVQREALMAEVRSKKAPGANQEGAPLDHPVRVPSPPETLYQVIAVYRYTRGNNDLTNPGMGYGELTPEACWHLADGKLERKIFEVRRTRSARQRIDPSAKKRGNSIAPPSAPPATSPA